MTADSMKSRRRPGTFPKTELDVYKAAWDREHTFDTMIGA